MRGGDGIAILEVASRRLTRLRRRLVGLLVLACLLSFVPDRRADRIFAGAAGMLIVAIALVTVAVHRLRRAPTWRVSVSDVRISTTGASRSQRVRAFIGNDRRSWRCPNVFGIETRQTFDGRAFVWLAPGGDRGVIAWPPAKVRIVTPPRQVT